ncbi:Predicted Rossmann fold nucleotide-binding protein [Nocardioides alpinus]|uniref:Rossmann fold nucleotide-binding protein n=1 Tax=Nocardioides alpinus TaxID=748909 RepID=A0A1I0X9Y8_9ACTN|nr:LOG family protein [Nocardioides alpinus]PKH44186.1 Rossmann fold nucleotide-binding protein [Nocardioides alpinus]SFA97118.1 Predicted Rossmann fold nucleotide-binding protein [Nocardioides alpinus]
MKHSRGRVLDVTSLADLDRRLAGGATTLAGWRVVGLDLTERGPTLLTRSLAQSLFLGCEFAEGEGDAVRRAGAVVLPDIPGVPIDPYRASLYAPRDLYDTPRYRDSLDARAYAWSQGRPDADDALAMDLHDHAVDVALETWLAGRSVVGVMGGHSLERGSGTYAAAARLGHGLGRDLTVATGGGPGAMEAANLGAFLADEPPTAVDDALQRLAAVPSFRPDVGAWARAAFEVIDAHGPGHDSLGVPTWHYGHEPPNPFATTIAKYFRNATREATLLEICNAGIVFLPGAAGTVQEVFQDACENYYGDPSTIAPMVLVGRRHWTEELPVWPLLRSLAQGRAMESHVHLVESLDEAVAAVSLSRPRGD